MKNLRIQSLLLAAILCFAMSSCYQAMYKVGQGAQQGVTVKGKNNYFLWGLAQGKQADTQQMADNKADYTIRTKMSFVDGLVSGLTFGIYNPWSVEVEK